MYGVIKIFLVILKVQHEPEVTKTGCVKGLAKKMVVLLLSIARLTRKQLFGRGSSWKKCGRDSTPKYAGLKSYLTTKR